MCRHEAIKLNFLYLRGHYSRIFSRGTGTARDFGAILRYS